MLTFCKILIRFINKESKLREDDGADTFESVLFKEGTSVLEHLHLVHVL